VGGLLLLATVSITLSLLLIASLIMYIIQKLRCELKTPEIGMLKAMGTTAQEFRYLYRVQAGVLWRRSVLWGFLLAGAVLAVVAWRAETTPAETGMLFRYFIGSSVAMGAATLLVIALSLEIGTKEARRKDPMDTIRLG
jgi:ABC-type antimicrobial peptide transport system permease subunit